MQVNLTEQVHWFILCTEILRTNSCICMITHSYTLSYKNSFSELMHQNYRIVLFVAVAQNSTSLDAGMFSKQKLNTMWAETVMANLRYNPGTHLEGLMTIFV